MCKKCNLCQLSVATVDFTITTAVHFKIGLNLLCRVVPSCSDT